MLKWIADDMKEDPKYIVDRVSTLIHGDISYALNAFRKDKSLSNDKNDKTFTLSIEMIKL